MSAAIWVFPAFDAGHRQQHQRRGLSDLRAGQAEDRLDRDLAAQLPHGNARRLRRPAERVEAVDVRGRKSEAGRRARDLRSARRQRLAEVDLGRRLPRLASSERDEQADDRARHEADQQQPPARDHRAPQASEIDFLLGVGVARAVGLVRGGRAHCLSRGALAKPGCLARGHLSVPPNPPPLRLTRLALIGRRL